MCLRQTLATLHQFSLDALREMLPRFVVCVAPVVEQNCGVVSLNVLRAMAAHGQICPIRATAYADAKAAAASSPPPLTCSADREQTQERCRAEFTAKHPLQLTEILFNVTLLVAANSNGTMLAPLTAKNGTGFSLDEVSNKFRNI